MCSLQIYTISVLILGLFCGHILLVEGCNEAVCASIVSKCTLTKACNCQLTTNDPLVTNEIDKSGPQLNVEVKVDNDLTPGGNKTCPCCRECFDCLSYLYSECCSCVELCPKPVNNYPYHLNYLNNRDNTGIPGPDQLKLMSQVGDLTEPIPDLFNILMEDKNDAQARWNSFTFPIDIPLETLEETQSAAGDLPSKSGILEENGKITDHSEVNGDLEDHKETQPVLLDIHGRAMITVNCTVAYMAECSMPLNKCKKTCHSMGASYFRWFHDGCCECIGKSCTNYGIDESRCANCARDELEDVETIIEHEAVKESSSSEKTKKVEPTDSSE